MTQRKFKIFLFNKCVGASQFVRSVDLTPNYWGLATFLKLPVPFVPKTLFQTLKY